MIAGQTSQLQIPQVFCLKTMLQQAVPRLFLFYLSEEEQIFDFLKKTFSWSFLATSIQSIQMVT